MARYDEDLHENLFFQTLIGKYSGLFKEAAEHRFLICVPRCDTVFRLKLGRTDFENHILRPSEGDSIQFTSLNNKSATIDGDSVKVGGGYKEARTVKILFDESFFNSREESYQVFCLEQPMEGAMGEDIMISLKNLEECNKFLWGDPGADKVRRSIDRLIDIFQVERGAMSMRPIMDAALAVYTRAVQEVFKIRKFEAAMHKSFCKLAVETYVMAGLHRKIFKEVCFIVAAKDAALNKITRNLSDTNPESLGIKPQFKLILPKARAVLSQLNQFATPLEKLYCFSQTITALTTEVLNEVVTADELLPILVYLVIVTDIPNWNGNLTYIHRFYFSNVTYEEFTYYLTSFEAAVEYVRSENNMILTNKTSPFISHASVEKFRSNSTSGEDETQVFFSMASEGNMEAIKQILEKAQLDKSNLKSDLCHPLCNCSKCSKILEKQLDDSDRASVYLRDQDGRTALHHAALIGHNELVQLLLEHGSIVTATDHNSSTPLHLSCLKGHQKCTLLLLGEGSNINAVDNHGNTPLHQACSNGHEECVKSLLFHTTQCEVSLGNEQGDTPLHNAARWGYASIVSELLAMNASLNYMNRRRETPQMCAQNRKVQDFLYSAYQNSKKKSSTGEAQGGGDDVDSPVVIRSRRMMSKRMSLRESQTDVDRQLNKLFRAIQDGDTNLVNYIFGWEESGTSAVTHDDVCHPLCICDRCSKLKKSTSVAILSVNCSDPFGHTPLHKACLLGKRVLVESFLRHGALLDTRTKDADLAPLHLACQYNHKDIVMLLLDYNVLINPRDSQGNTPLHLACTNGHVETATLLLMHGADVTVTNHRGDTPLHNASRWNSPHLVNDLLLYGASYTAINNNSKQPIELTTDEEVKDIIWKASNGLLLVGSYSPLRHKGVGHTTKDPRSEELKKEGQLPSGHVTVAGVEGGGGVSDTRDIGCGSCDHSPKSSSGNQSPFEVLEHRTLGSQGQSSTQQGHGSLQGQSSTQGQSSLPVADLTTIEEVVSLHRPHPSSKAENSALSHRPHPSSKEEDEEDLHRPHTSTEEDNPALLHRPHPSMEEGDNPSLSHRPHPSEDSALSHRPHPSEEEDSALSHRPHPKRDEKLISLLQAIESFDRSRLSSLSFMDTPPYSPHHHGDYYPSPEDEEMQTTGLGSPLGPGSEFIM